MTDEQSHNGGDVSKCPDAGTWKTFLDGDVLDEAAADLAAHLEDCKACQQTLERLAAGKETWEGTAKQLADVDAANAEAGIESSGHLQAVLDDLKQGIDVGPAATASSRDVLRFLEPSGEPGSIGRLDSYEILEVVGAGGMGVVLRGWDPTLRRVVAIKVLAAHLANSAAAERRFVREAQAAAAVSHDHVVAIHAVGAGHEPPYLVMQFVEGKTLQQRLDRSGPLHVNEILRIGQQTALGLAAAHRQGIVHRDIKPANILLENGVERVRITDFGLARAIDDASMTQSGVVAGTPLFMAPEQAQGQPVDHRSDLFSLGSVLYAMATGRPPFRSSTMMGVIRRVCDDQPRPIREINPDIPDWLCGIIDRLLAKDPAERFQTADEVAELLAGFLAHVQHPLSVPLPAIAAAFAPRSTRIEEPEPTITFQTPPQPAVASTTGPEPAANDVDATARALLKWPAALLFITGLVNLLIATGILLYLTVELGIDSYLLIAQKLWALVPCGLCLFGALQMGSLRSRVWGYVAIVTAFLGVPGIVLGLPAGIWALRRLGRPEVIAAFDRRSSSDWVEPSPLAVPLTFGLELVRLLIIGAFWLLAIAVPLGSYVLAEDSGAFPDVGLAEKTMLGIAVLAVIFGLATVLKHLERRRQGASGKSEIRSTIARQIRRVPEVLVCTLLGVFTMQAIYADLTTLHYDRFMESVIIPLFCVTLATLGIVVFINRRRIRELQASGQEDPELTSAYRTAITVPLGLLVPIIVLLGLWGYRQSTVGYVAFDVDNPMSIVSFRNVKTDKAQTLSASWKRIRLPVGTYEWSVSEGPIQNMVIDSGTIKVQPRVGQLISTGIDKAEALRRLVGTWKYVSGNVQWDASNGPAPDWAQPPMRLGIYQYGTQEQLMAVFMSTDENAADLDDRNRLFACELRADTNPRSVSLLDPNPKIALVPNPDIDPKDWPCVAQGYWQVGQNGLYLILGPAGELRLPNTYSVPTDRFARYQFERVLNEQVSDEKSSENGADAASLSEAELQRRIQLGPVSAEVLEVQQAPFGGRTYVEISIGSDHGFREGDDLIVFRKNSDGKDEYIAEIHLVSLHPSTSGGVVMEKAKGKSVEVGDHARLGRVPDV